MNNYQTQAISFARFEHADYAFLALSEEVGEVSGKLAKYVRKNSVSLTTAIEEARTGATETGAVLREDLTKELGDVLWQLSACCTMLGLSLEDVADANIAKLSGREDRGTIVGEGDSR